MSLFLETWKRYFTWIALFSCFINVLQLTFPFYMFTIYRNIVVSYSGYSLFNISVLAFFALLVLGLFSYVRSRLLSAAGHALNQAIRESICKTMFKSSVIISNRAYKGGLNEVLTLQNFLSSPTVYAVFDAPWTPFYLILIYLFHPVLGGLATGGAIVMVGLTLLQEFLIRNSMGAANRIMRHNQLFVSSFIRNAEVTVGMGMVKNVTGRFLRKNLQVMENQTKSSDIAGIIQAIIKPLQNVIQVLIYCFGAYFVIIEGFDAGMMVAGSIIMGRALAPLMQVTSGWRQASSAREAYFRLKKVSIVEAARIPTMALPPPAGELKVEQVGFGSNERVWLHSVSFSLKPGETLGIIGPSGAGKTTLCRLLLGIWPSVGGKVYLDGRDIFAWNKREIGPYMGYLPQEVELFPCSVARNIARLGAPDPDLLDRAILESGCKELIEQLPQGPDTELEGEKGVKLSGGQKQRVGLARALYGNPTFLVLDEPTANMDQAGELQLLKALAGIRERGKTTCIMVTHKPSLLQAVDKVLVIRNGTAAAFGPRDQVMAQLAGNAAVGTARQGRTAAVAGGVL